SDARAGSRAREGSCLCELQSGDARARSGQNAELRNRGAASIRHVSSDVACRNGLCPPASAGEGDSLKYVVEINGRRHEVTVREGSVAYDGESDAPAELGDIAGSPVRMVRIGSDVFRVVAEKREGRGRFSLWVDGHRFEAEALDERRRALRDLTGAAAGPTGPAPIIAPMPGLIV